MAGTRPVAMGGANFYHWVGVRGRDGDTLLLANPGPGWRARHQTLSRAELAALGPFAAVWVEDNARRPADAPAPPATAGSKRSTNDAVRPSWPSGGAALHGS